MTVLSQTPYNNYVANGVTTVFAYGFQVINASDLVVKVDGVLKTLTADYTLSGVGSASGGTVTFLSAPTSLAVVAIYRSSVIQRTQDYQGTGDFLAGTFNGDFDRLWLVLQELYSGPAGFGRMLKAPPGETLTDLPAAASRANMVQAYDSAGQPTVQVPSTGSAADVLTQLASTTDATKGARLSGYNPALAYATGSVGIKLKETVSAREYGAVGDDATNNDAALALFFNSANANPGVPHRIAPGVYRIAAALPTITASNVIIDCPGADIHDVGSITSGAVIKWVGAAGATMLTVAPVTGASAQRMANLRLKGIAFDANNLAANCLVAKSLRNSVIDVAVVNPTAYGVTLGVVATLGEARDPQDNDIRIIARCVEAAGGCALTLTGDATANVSMNRIYVDGQHKNQSLVICVNSDNNDWTFFRAFMVGGGAASESCTLQGGASSGIECRSERFHFVTANKPFHAYGTGGAVPYTVASTNSRIYVLDKNNGTPDPLVEPGASFYWQNDSTPFGDTPWEAFTTVVTPSAGAITAYTATAKKLKRGRLIYGEMNILITNAGTGSGFLNCTIPDAANAVFVGIINGQERANTGKQVIGSIAAGTSTIALRFYDGTYPGAVNNNIALAWFYEPT